VSGVTDGRLLSAFPILVVVAAFACTRLDCGIAALVASLAMIAVYHAGLVLHAPQ
jgi:hypothetical protein